MTSLSLPKSTYNELLTHLGKTEMEQVAFLFTEPAADNGVLRVREIYRVPEEGFDFQSDLHVALTDQVRADVIKRAHQLEGSIVEVHSHESEPPPWFSGSDLYGFRDWVPHVRWRLGGRPYVALVFTGDEFDAMVWEGDGNAATPLVSLNVDGEEPREPSGITLRRLAKGRR